MDLSCGIEGSYACIGYAANALFWWFFSFPFAAFLLKQVSNDWKPRDTRGWIQLVLGSIISLFLATLTNVAGVMFFCLLLGVGDEVFVPVFLVSLQLQICIAAIWVFPPVASAYGAYKHPPYRW